jgi:hypothetical protein
VSVENFSIFEIYLGLEWPFAIGKVPKFLHCELDIAHKLFL